MKFELAPLPYAYDALAPVIDEETMHLHHDKHHQAYVNNLNKAIEGVDLDFKCPICVLRQLDKLPADRQAAARNNAGGHANHTFFWKLMTPGGAKEPVGQLKAAIEKRFGSVEAMKEQFEAAGAARFGSGWVWLVVDAQGDLQIVSTPNQDHPCLQDQEPVLGNDVWEHAYYLTYQNRRPDYLENWWNVVNWDEAEKNYLAAIED